jgi:hypothetical protein
LSKGPRKRTPSSTRFHKRAVRHNRRSVAMPQASDVEVYDAVTGELLRTERTKKPLT